MAKEEILIKIRSRTAKVSIFRLGRVGLPLASKIAEAGFRLVGVDET